ncbi:MAG TPA: hypothetical protein VK277_07390 [Acidimicrobiales bacterium]|nr:hypothetical protein [Acidimicrobiales bacterium]
MPFVKETKELLVIRHRARAAVVGALLAAALALAGCSSNGTAAPTTTSTTTAASTTTTTAAAAGAPCTQAAISAAAMAAPSIGHVMSVDGFGCAGGWAYADVVVGTTSANSFDAVIVLQSQGASWNVADRGTACSQHLVPAAIYQRGCTTS